MKYLADTSGLLALMRKDDRHHESAARWIRSHPRSRFVLTDLVVAELATRLRALAGAARAVGVVRDLLDGGRHDVVYLDASLMTAALADMERYADHRLSLTDCASFALMRQLGIEAAFTFDADFRACGFAMVP